MFNHISRQDQALLIEAYKRQVGEKADAFKFVEEVRIRFIDESTLSIGSKQNQDFQEYINHETHVALEKNGCKWVQPKCSSEWILNGGRFYHPNGSLMEQDFYQLARKKTIEAFVAKALPVLATREECTVGFHYASPEGHAHYRGCLRVPLTPELSR